MSLKNGLIESRVTRISDFIGFEKGEYMSEDRLNYIEKEISKTPLYSLLGADGIDELKSRIIDIICDQVQKDLRDSSYYLISPDDVNDTLGENIVQEAIDELKEEWKDKIKEYMSQKLEAMMK